MVHQGRARHQDPASLMTLEDRALEHQGSVKTATRLSAALVVAAAFQEEATQAADQAVLADQAVQADQAHQAHRTDLVVEAVAQEGNVPMIVMDGLTSSVRCPAGGAPQPASIPSPAEDPARSSPTTPNVPMFRQDARGVMMSAPVEMGKMISWTTDQAAVAQEEATQAAVEAVALEACGTVK